MTAGTRDPGADCADLSPTARPDADYAAWLVVGVGEDVVGVVGGVVGGVVVDDVVVVAGLVDVDDVVFLVVVVVFLVVVVVFLVELAGGADVVRAAVVVGTGR